MSDMTTQEMIEWSLAQASKCHAAQGIPDLAARFEAIAARLKALEDAIRHAPCGTVPEWPYGCRSICNCWKRAVLDAAREEG